MGKKLAIVGGALLVLIVAGLVVVYLSLNNIIRSAVETYGPQVTKTDVKLGGVSVSPFAGTAELSNLVVGNPKGYTTPSAFKLGALQMSLDVGSLRSDTVAIREIIVAAPEITYELGPGGNNLKVIQKNAEEFSGGGGKEAKETPAKGTETKVTIDRLQVTNAKVNFSAPQLQGEPIALKLPDIEMKDIGKKGKGATFDVVIEEVLKEVERHAATAVAGVDVKGLAEKAQKEAEKEAEGAAGKALKGIFGK